MARKEKQNTGRSKRATKDRLIRNHRVVRVDFAKKKVITKTMVSKEEFNDLLDAVMNCLEDLPNVDIENAKKTVWEMRFVNALNYHWRQTTYPELEDLFLDLYERT